MYHWYSVHLPTEGWPDWVDLGDWLHTKIVYVPSDSVTHTDTNWVRLTYSKLSRLRITNTVQLQQCSLQY